MRTEVGPVTIPMVENESRRTLGYKCNKDSRLTSPTLCPQIKSPFQETAPNLMETSSASSASCQAERVSYQLQISSTSSAITAVGNASLSLEQAVMLVLAVEKFKQKLKQPSGDGWEYDGGSFMDTDLLGNFSAIIEEATTCSSYDAAENVSSTYRFVSSECHQMKDDQDRSLILSENLQLLAMSLQQPKNAVQLDMRYYKTAAGNDVEGLPVVLKISSQNLYLSCTGPQDRPIMQLEKWDQNLKNINGATDLLRFVFFKKVFSSGLHFELESAKYHGWYISTSKKNRQPVEMDEKENHKRITVFTAD
ncbi:interleukin-1 beta-like [Cetorhinus maximus]